MNRLGTCPVCSRRRRCVAGRCRSCWRVHPRRTDPPPVVLDAAALLAQPDTRARVAVWLTRLGIDPTSAARVELLGRCARIYPTTGQPYTITLPERAAAASPDQQTGARR